MKNNKMKKEIQVLKEEARLVMDPDQRQACHKLIHTAALAAGGVGAGLAQLPGTDSALIVPIQIAMIQKLGRLFNVKITESSAETIIGTGLATMAGRGLSQFLVGFIPLAGNLINASTASLITELLGWIIANSFAQEHKKNGSF